VSFPRVSITAPPATDSDAEALILVLPPTSSPVYDDAAWQALRPALDAVGFTGTLGTMSRIWVPEVFPRPTLAVGTGPVAGSEQVRFAVGAAVRTLTGFDTVSVVLPGLTADMARAAAEGAVLGGYRFDGYHSRPPARRAADVRLHLPGARQEDVDRAAVVGAAAALVKDLAGTPAEWLGPVELAERAVAEVADLPVTVTVLDQDALVDGGYGGIVGVGQGSDRPPRMVRLDYSPARAGRHVAIVGKGITFDSGGLSLKPAAGMVGMKYDMTGAATALAVIRTAATLRAPVHLTAFLCLADNMPSGRALRPGDVVRMLDGTTVEVTNTDAEGRLVLADGLVAASREHPDLIIDVATLTGAVSVALGTRHAGVMGDDDPVAEYLTAAAAAGEQAWRLPLPAHMEEDLESPIADLVNAKVGDPAGGTVFAGLFLHRFVGRQSEAPDAEHIPWLHLDIAGVAMNKGSAFGFTDKGPTAATVRALVEMVCETP
jgi:leucyl aminopeptidase